MDTYDAKVLADSVSPDGIRLITVQATFPRFILAEVNTHRVFSRNSASSRAIPPEQLIERVREHPFVPATFNIRVKGMGVGEEVNEVTARQARMTWLAARNHAAIHAEKLLKLGLDKSRINRLLEPFMWHTAIISSTEWDNFFALRCPPGEEATIDFPAQLEFQKVAILMRRAMRESEPVERGYGEWHMPLVTNIETTGFPADPPSHPYTNEDGNLPLDYWPMVSAGRCARVSYDTHENYEESHKSYARAEGLRDKGHLSPFEHVATPDPNYGPFTQPTHLSNFRGWTQLRAQVPHEENRVGHLDQREPWDA